MSDTTAALIGVGIANAAVLIVGVAWLLISGRRGKARAERWRTGPKCDRCGRSTRKPVLYRMPSQHWRCEPCEQAVTDILFTAATNGTLTERHLRYTRPFLTDRATEK